MKEQNENPLISFIIPAFNASETLIETITSIKSNSNSEILYEIIIVENGSSDDTFEIANKLSDETENIYCVKSEKGVSNARNKGIEISRGKWIIFIDADDKLNKDSLQIVKSDINTNCDLICYGHTINSEHLKVTQHDVVYNKNEIKSAICMMLKEPTKYMQAWAKLFNRKVILENNIRFDNRLSYAEDSDFTFQYLLHCDSLKLSHYDIYDYSISTSSAMRSFDGKKAKQYNIAMEKMLNYSTDDSKILKQAVYNYILIHLNIVLVREVYSKLNSASDKEKKVQMESVLAMNSFNTALKSIKFKNCLSIKMLPSLFIKLHLKFLAVIMFKLRANQNYNREVKNNV